MYLSGIESRRFAARAALPRQHSAGLSVQRPLDWAHFMWHKSAVAVLRGDWKAAHEHVRESCRSADALGCKFGSIQGRILLVEILMQLNQRENARREADDLVIAARSLQSQVLEYAGRLLRSYVIWSVAMRVKGLQPYGRRFPMGRIPHR